MKILVACEESQRVCIAFRAKGHDAYSCDIEPPSGGKPEWHIQQNVKPLLQETWDMVIAFPPCTHLCSSGARWWKEKQADGRQQEAIEFFMACIRANAPKICVENPQGIMSTAYEPPSQYIEPWMFGENAEKKTGLWLKGLMPLKATNIVNTGEKKVFTSGKTMSDWYYKTSCLSPKDRAKARSKTFPGIAKAMAEQWG